MVILFGLYSGLAASIVMDKTMEPARAVIVFRLYNGLATSTAMDKTMELERDDHSVRTIQWISRVNSHG